MSISLADMSTDCVQADRWPAIRIWRNIPEGISDLDELCAIWPVYPRPKSMTPREWLAKFKAEGGVLPKPRITITTAMQRPCAN